MIHLAVVNCDCALTLLTDAPIAMENDRFLLLGVGAAIVDGINACLDHELLVELLSPVEVVRSV